eukprot:SAG22_NODE_476_length_9995_cov_9.488480_7_plen_126_part_01
MVTTAAAGWFYVDANEDVELAEAKQFDTTDLVVPIAVFLACWLTAFGFKLGALSCPARPGRPVRPGRVGHQLLTGTLGRQLSLCVLPSDRCPDLPFVPGGGGGGDKGGGGGARFGGAEAHASDGQN